MEVDRQGRERGVTGKVAGKAAIRGGSWDLAPAVRRGVG